MLRTRTLPNGLRIVTEQVPAVRSCGIGIWLERGSRHERGDERGLTHFIEHMLFKGTSRRDVQAIADAMNYLGGNVNAYTTQEQICLHARTIDRKAHEALELLCEMLADSIFPEDELRRERKVVLEECRMVEDTPDEFSIDLFMKNLWPGHPLGEPIIGTRETIRRFGREQLVEFWRRQFRPDRVVVALAGAFDAAACNRVIRRWLAPLHAGAKSGARGERAPSRSLVPVTSALTRPVEQAHFCLGCPAVARTAPERYAFDLLNMVLGGGMSSRLFQEIREKRGLAYSIGSFVQGFRDTGSFAVHGGTSPRSLGEVLAITRGELERIAGEAVPERELELARAQVLDAIVMGLENMEARMARLADSLMSFGRILPVDEVMAGVSAVTPEDVLAVARRYLRRPLALGLVGPRGERGLLRKAIG